MSRNKELEDFKLSLAEFLAPVKDAKDLPKHNEKRQQMSYWRGLFIDYTIEHEILIELLVAVHFVGRNWKKVNEFRTYMFPPESPLSFKYSIGIQIIQTKLPQLYASLQHPAKKEKKKSIPFTTHFLPQISGIRNKFAHYPFIFSEHNHLKIENHQLKSGKIKVKSLELTEEAFFEQLAMMWLANDFIYNALLKIAFDKPDGKYIIKREKQNELPNFIQPVSVSYVA